MIKSPFPQKSTPKILQKCSTKKKKKIPAVIINLQKYLLILIIAVLAEYLPVAGFVNIALC